MVITVTFMAFKFADYAQVNQGVIASLFTSGVVFTTLLFWLVYKEKPSFWTFIGMLIIITGVVSVSLGKTSTYTIDEESEETSASETTADNLSHSK